MPAIWNVGNTNGYSEKKISSKLTFEEGETFKGRIVGKGDGEGVLIKLIDGWQFSADLLDESAAEGQQLLQFKVEGFEDGKIKLKIVTDSQPKEEIIEDDAVKDFISKEGISKDDFTLLKAMTKFNIPLFKDNIDFVKSVFNLSQKLGNKVEIDEFINNYISGKGIDPQTLEAAAIRNTLNEFFTAFETMNQDDILLFLENGIDINKENIDSYNKLFKGDITIKEQFDNVLKEFKNLDFKESIISNKQSLETDIGKEVNPKSINNDEILKYSQKQTMGLKIYDDTTSSKSRVSLLNLLKAMSGEDTNFTHDTVKDILIGNRDVFKESELQQAFTKLNSMSEKELQDTLKEAIGGKTITKESLEDALKNIFGKDIKISEAETNKLKDILNPNSNKTENAEQTEQFSKEQAQTSNKQTGTIMKGNSESQKGNDVQKTIIKEGKTEDKSPLSQTGKTTSSMIVKNEFSGKINDMKDVIRHLLSQSEELTDKTLEGKLSEFIKSNINDFKLFNALSNEYYYLDIPISRENADYPCKLIIKDDRKGNKKIDSSNVKMVVAVKTINMGTVDAYISVLDNNLTVDIKCIDKYMKFLLKGTKQLTEKLSSLGYFVNVNVHEKIDEVGLTTCREFFNSGSNSALDTKV